MEIISNDHVVCFDVDETLIIWHWDQYKKTELSEANQLIDIKMDNYSTSVEPFKEHIELLKRYKAKGKFIIVWTQSGYKWGEAVVKALGLEEYVDLVLTKPEKYVDDLDANEWMEHVYKGVLNKETPHN